MGAICLEHASHATGRDHSSGKARQPTSVEKGERDWYLSCSRRIIFAVFWWIDSSDYNQLRGERFTFTPSKRWSTHDHLSLWDLVREQHCLWDSQGLDGRAEEIRAHFENTIFTGQQRWFTKSNRQFEIFDGCRTGFKSLIFFFFLVLFFFRQLP